jgi:hypothetical protein
MGHPEKSGTYASFVMSLSEANGACVPGFLILSSMLA